MMSANFLRVFVLFLRDIMYWAMRDPVQARLRVVLGSPGLIILTHQAAIMVSIRALICCVTSLHHWILILGSLFPNSVVRNILTTLFPLAAAWDLGAAQWPQRKRTSFANDIERNLVVVSGDVNIDKGDSTPSEWLPPWKGSQCWYAARYLTVAIYYQLAITEADWHALSGARRLCHRS